MDVVRAARPAGPVPRRLTLFAGAADIAWHTEAIRRLSANRDDGPPPGRSTLIRYGVRTVTGSVARRVTR